MADRLLAVQRVGYVMTHYPKVAQTFIAGEIAAVEAQGVAIQCLAMNAPEASERSVAGAAEKIARTRYLKQQLGGGLVALLSQTLRAPLQMARIFGVTLRSAGGSPARLARRFAHLVQAAFVAKEAKRLDLHHLHAHFGLAPATIAWLASKIVTAQGHKIGFGYTIHGFHDFVDAAESRLDLKAQDADYVLCISDFTRSQLMLVTDPALWPKFRIARCGVDVDAIAYRARTAMPAEPVVMALGRLSAEKGFTLLIEAIGLLAKQGLPFKLRIVGEGPMRPMLTKAIAQFGVADRVTLVGELAPSAVREELSRADIFCLPSFSEGLPVSIMEAMAAGVPVVTTWISGIPELAVSGETALTVAPGRADALADALRRLVQEAGLGQQLARNARERVVVQHDAMGCAKRVIEIMQEGHP